MAVPRRGTFAFAGAPGAALDGSDAEGDSPVARTSSRGPAGNEPVLEQLGTSGTSLPSGCCNDTNEALEEQPTMEVSPRREGGGGVHVPQLLLESTSRGRLARLPARDIVVV